MNPLNKKDIIVYVEKHISSFHTKRLKRLEQMKLKTVLKRKNPYLFKAKNILVSSDLIKTFLDAHLSSQEETIFGEFLEGLAIFICGKVFHGKKSAAEGIDLEFERDELQYIVAIKSGPNWANSDQMKKMKINFRKAKKILGTNTSKKNIVAVNGCCYGKDNTPDKGEYLKYCGQRFWEFISENGDLYTDIIEPLGHKAKEKNERFMRAHAKVVNKFTSEFEKEFCNNWEINWQKLVEFNSSIQPFKKK